MEIVVRAGAVEDIHFVARHLDFESRGVRDLTSDCPTSEMQ
jgi:hypothetical protein